MYLIFIIATLWLAVILIFINARISRSRYMRLRKNQIHNEEYGPKSDMKPAELGMTYDANTGNAEMAATLIDLHVRNVIALKQIRAGSGTLAGEYSISKGESSEPLETFEKYLVDKLFESGQSVKLTDFLVGPNFSLLSAKFSLKVMQSLQRKGYMFFYEGYENETYEQAIKQLLKRLVSIKGLYSIIGGIGTSALYATDKLKNDWPQIAGYRTYLEVAEKDRFTMDSNPKTHTQFFDRHLAYAIAVGVDDVWKAELLGARKLTSQQAKVLEKSRPQISLFFDK